MIEVRELTQAMLRWEHLAGPEEQTGVDYEMFDVMERNGYFLPPRD